MAFRQAPAQQLEFNHNIDPKTGQPYGAFNPATGQYVTQPSGAFDPATGQPIPQNTFIFVHHYSLIIV
jgi:thiamine biosynthesis lipoprotein ApbE